MRHKHGKVDTKLVMLQKAVIQRCQIFRYFSFSSCNTQARIHNFSLFSNSETCQNILQMQIYPC